MMHFKFIFAFLSICSMQVQSHLIQGNCTNEYVECEMGNVCLPLAYICDDKPQCPDGSDEAYCRDTSSIVPELSKRLVQGNCYKGYVECEMGTLCLEEKYVCNGQSHCPDGSDEKYCSNLDLNKESANKFITLVPEEATTTTETVSITPSSEEVANSMETDHHFALGDDVDHCKQYRRLIHLTARVQIKLQRMEPKTARLIKNLISEILSESNMESFSSLLELHKMCSNNRRIVHSQQHSFETTELPLV